MSIRFIKKPMADPRITRSVAIYIILELKKIIMDGWGPVDTITGDMLPGIIDEIPSDTNANRFANHCMHMARFIAGILKQAILDADQESRSIDALMSEDIGEL